MAFLTAPEKLTAEQIEQLREGLRQNCFGDWKQYSALCDMALASLEYITALQEIAKGAGPFSRDPMEHAINTIANMKAVAVDALK